jgi:hypothetical protein
MPIEIDDQTVSTAKELAARESRGVSDVIRDAVTINTAQRNRSLPKGAGKYGSGYTDTARTADEILTQAVAERTWP